MNCIACARQLAEEGSFERQVLGNICRECKFTLSKLPMPPSENHQYAARAFPGKHGKNYDGPRKVGFTMARICPTSDLEKYQKSVEAEWKEKNLIAVYKCRDTLKQWMMKGLYIHVTSFAFWEYFDIFTKEGLPRKSDATNRVKALHDSLARVLEIDDCWFWNATVGKYTKKTEGQWCAVEFRPVEHQTLGQLKERGIL